MARNFHEHWTLIIVLYITNFFNIYTKYMQRQFIQYIYKQSNYGEIMKSDSKRRKFFTSTFWQPMRCFIHIGIYAINLRYTENIHKQAMIFKQFYFCDCLWHLAINHMSFNPNYAKTLIKRTYWDLFFWKNSFKLHS